MVFTLEESSKRRSYRKLKFVSNRSPLSGEEDEENEKVEGPNDEEITPVKKPFLRTTKKGAKKRNTSKQGKAKRRKHTEESKQKKKHSSKKTASHKSKPASFRYPEPLEERAHNSNSRLQPTADRHNDTEIRVSQREDLRQYLNKLDSLRYRCRTSQDLPQERDERSKFSPSLSPVCSERNDNFRNQLSRLDSLRYKGRKKIMDNTEKEGSETESTEHDCDIESSTELSIPDVSSLALKELPRCHSEKKNKITSDGLSSTITNEAEEGHTSRHSRGISRHNSDGRVGRHRKGFVSRLSETLSPGPWGKKKRQMKNEKLKNVLDMAFWDSANWEEERVLTAEERKAFQEFKWWST